MMLLLECTMLHYEILKYYRSTSKVHAQVLQNLIVRCLQVALPLLLAAWTRSAAMPSVHACLAHTLADVAIACAKFDHR